MLYIIGGTSEANITAAELRREGYQITLSVATEWGSRLAAEAGGHLADTGRLDASGMLQRAGEVGAAAIIDCSHPFAEAVSSEARKAADIKGVPYFRFCRPPLDPVGKKAIRASSWHEAAGLLKDRPGRSLLTVGIRNLALFMEHKIDFTARILPLSESFAECRRLGLDPRNLIAAHPPFSVEFNRACIRHAGAGILVTKDSGEAGGLREKEAAVLAEGVDLMIVDRPPEKEADAIFDIESLIVSLNQTLSH